MRLTVFGASGGIGTEVVSQALTKGHEVTAVVRDPARLLVTPTAGLIVVRADVMDPAALVPVLEGAAGDRADGQASGGRADAVVSALGPRRGGPVTVLADSMRAILAAMDKTGVRRLVAVSASGFFAEAGEGLLTGKVGKPLLQRILRDNTADTRRMEELITANGAEWTIMRPARLTNGPRRPYRTALDRYVSARIGRADVADAILGALADPATAGHRVNVGY